ncbi:hypothetical protein Pmani_023888 [Petrolisthes manimaculis]|uniref:Uncharacterized protein n=1 Tax=Petrolisthes manimaculis TaxID=1843537 RepID=A0AAE1P992_9EUCA|nr:hypothetical protein Pmani_023888 [Petrolisthes manimaculis]
MSFVRSSDTDVLVILVGALGQQHPEIISTNKIIMDCGMGNTRRFIISGLAAALPGMGQRQGDTDLEVASEFVCRMYGQSNTVNVNDAKHKKLMHMSSNINKENPLENVKKIDCALLPHVNEAFI